MGVVKERSSKLEREPYPMKAQENSRKKPIKASGSLSMKAYEEVRRRILHGDYPIGASLARRQLAEEFAMSVLPVSEALQRLEVEGLVESRARIGTRVRIPRPSDVRGHVIVREALESQAARLFALRADKDQRVELKRLAIELDALWDHLSETDSSYRDDLYRVHEMHSQFHHRLAQGSGCPELADAIEHVLVFIWLYDLFLGLGTTPPHWHERLADAVIGGDPIQADDTMRQHVQNGLDQLLQRLEPYLRWDENQLNKLPRLRRVAH